MTVRVRVRQGIRLDGYVARTERRGNVIEGRGEERREDRCKSKRRVYKRDTVCSYLRTEDPPSMASRLQYGVR